MTRLAALLLVAFLAIAILLFLTNPELLDKVWLWVIGFIGYIVTLFEKGFGALSKTFQKESTLASEKESVQKRSYAEASALHETNLQLQKKIQQIEAEMQQQSSAFYPLASHTLSVLRYQDDGESTLGLLFLRKKFFAYTLEDTHRVEKLAGKTRIPSGTYAVNYYPHLTPLTKKYQQNHPWFQYHLEIKDIPKFKNVYIHIGNTHQHTEGCLLIADGINSGSASKMITHSKFAYERFYKIISALLNSGEEVQICIMDEDWFEQAKLPNL
ncbi:DUF5675 family protein [Porifericola rhodea]|uniref:DUF5675 family protein n=1 Tax=Porifericola rhodea TaxID=930972 RepID=UPI0026657A66|nr:DUF5675 family protein [Porifericola rhodea]WKN33296.1 DUF5675 family protein [Porifericola rhodea]